MKSSFKSRGMTEYLVHDPKTNTTARIAVSSGRQRDTLEVLIRCGATGCNFWDYRAPRWAAYVHRLRAQGFDILTVKEKHSGAYPGYHARYVLVSEVTRLAEEVEA